MAKKTSGKLIRMGELVRRTGVQKETIRFYISNGLLPRPLKTKKNMAYYDETYVERIRLIKEFQLKRFLPLKVIKEIIHQTDDELSASELDLIKAGGPSLFRLEELRREYEPVTLCDLSERTGLPPEEIVEMERCEIISSFTNGQGEKVYPDIDIRIAESFAEIRKGGLTKELGFEVKDFRRQSDAISMLAIEEVKDFVRKLAQRFPNGAELLPKIAENGVDNVNVFISLIRRKKILEAVEALAQSGEDVVRRTWKQKEKEKRRTAKTRSQN